MNALKDMADNVQLNLATNETPYTTKLEEFDFNSLQPMRNT